MLKFFGLESKYFSRNEHSCWPDWKKANFHFSDKTEGKEKLFFGKNFYDSLTVHLEHFVDQIAVINIQ